MHNTRSYNNVVTNYWVLSVNWKGERLCVLKAKKPDTAEGWSPSSSLQLLFQDELMVPMVAAVSSGECSGTYAALRAAEGQGVLWAWAATQGTVVRLEAGGLVRSGFQLCSGQTSGVSYLGCYTIFCEIWLAPGLSDSGDASFLHCILCVVQCLLQCTSWVGTQLKCQKFLIQLIIALSCTRFIAAVVKDQLGLQKYCKQLHKYKVINSS